jgi:uncharacterized repeat protein (TIGR01451 family)
MLLGMIWALMPAVAHAAPHAAQGRSQLGGLRVPFIANQGQLDARVAFYAPTFAGTAFVTTQGDLVYSLPGRTVDASAEPGSTRRASTGPGWSLTETFRGGTVRPTGRDRSTPGVSSFIGNDPARWRREIPMYERLSLGDVWPGVAVSLRASGRSIEKIFTVAPGVSIDRIRVRVGGARGLRVDANGALVARTGLGDVTFTAPVAYQERDGVRHPIPVTYRVTGREYGFRVGTYDADLPLVIDPLLQVTYLGSSGFDHPYSVAIHPATGEVYVAGFAGGIDFPGTAGGAQEAPAGGSSEGGGDAFVARLSSDLTVLVQATYVGGSGGDFARGLTIHPTTGDVYVVGNTTSIDFPGTAGGAQAGIGGGGLVDHAFVARLNSDLTALVQATYLGGSGSDHARSVAIHPATGEVYVAGSTTSSNFPGTAGGAQAAFDGGFSDAFVARLNISLTALTQATYLGGSDGDHAVAIAIHPTTGDVYVAGSTTSADFPGTAGGAQSSFGGGNDDGFVARLSSSLTVLIQATYLGGDGPFDRALAVTIHPATGDVYVAGSTTSANFPGTAGGAQPSAADPQDAFVARLSSSLTALTQATYLGGDDLDIATSLAIHATTGEVYVAGYTSSPDFPGTAGGAQAALDGAMNAFIARLSSSLTRLTQATYLGGHHQAHALAIHPTAGDVYVTGVRGSGNDTFVARLTASLQLVDGPDLTVDKSHSGPFSQGQVGATYIITVSNVGTVPTDGTAVTVADTLPAGLTATALSGPGWSCALNSVTCTRSNALASGASYPSITLTVNVAIGASGSVTNTVTVSGGGDVIPGNNTATDTTTLVPDVTITKAHGGDFTRGQVGASYTIVVTNVGTALTAGAVTVTDTLPAGLTATAISGSGWNCELGPLACTRSDALANGSSYSAITLTVNVANTSTSSVTNRVTVSGGGDVNTTNNAAIDVTTITFADVPTSDPFFTWINGLLTAGITAGCSTSPPLYCPEAGVTRGQMAVFLLRGIHGAGYTPPAPSGIFADVLLDHPFAAWIEQLFVEGITGGCGTNPLRYCQDDSVTRGQMAVFLLRAKHGAGYQPPEATGMFADVPLAHPFARWIEQLAREGITGGCGINPARYCPDQSVTRGQMAVFLVRTFGLPL